MFRITRFLLIFFGLFISSWVSAEMEQPPAWVEFNAQRFYVEVAADGASHARGLMAREHLAADHGMLFIFPDRRLRAFWMKHTLFPLDIIYLDSDYKVVDMALQVRPCKTLNCPTYPSRAPVQYVLEINGGLARRHGLNMGDKITVFLP